MDSLTNLFSEYQTLLNSQSFTADKLDYDIFTEHLHFLNQLDAVGNSAISVFDLYKQEHIYISQKFASSLGYNLNEVVDGNTDFFNDKVHPEDFEQLTRNGITLLKMAFSLPPEERLNYKLINDYRLKHGTGKYIRVIEQHQVLENDPKDNCWLALSILDISPNQDLHKKVLSQLFNFRNGEIVPFESGQKPVLSTPLSNRERQILHLIKEGHPSKIISDQLFISVHTVNTHRQRILEKLNAKNSLEALRYAEQHGLLS